MNYNEALKYGLEKQGISVKIDEIPINIFLKNTGDILTLCFIEKETENWLVVVETNNQGAEEIRVIPKENIEYISICYDSDTLEEDNPDRMFR